MTESIVTQTTNGDISVTRVVFLRFMSVVIISAGIATVVLACAGAAFAQPTITNLGVLGWSDSCAMGVSADGSTVVGWSHNASNLSRPFRWTATGGMVDLGTLPGGDYADARGVNADGTVVVGLSDSSVGHRAFRWTAAGGMQNLGTLPRGIESQASGVSHDGEVVVGWSFSGDGNQAFRWTSAGGMQNIGTLPGFEGQTIARGVSGDGSVVVGDSGAAGGVWRAFHWSETAGMQHLGVLPGRFHSFAHGVNDDGSVVVGNSSEYGAVNDRAFRWTSAGGMQNLGTLPGGSESFAFAVSGDGTAVVGQSRNSSGFYRAILWTSSLEMVDLNTYLPSLGVDLTGWELIGARGVSDDGSAIAGFGHFNGDARGWFVTCVPVTGAPFPGDHNADVTVDAADYVVWRKGLGTIYTQDDYEIWRANFGAVAGRGTAANARPAVPEPMTLTILMVLFANHMPRVRGRLANYRPLT
jgi:probable HAF family extracellular repeat protein